MSRPVVPGAVRFPAPGAVVSRRPSPGSGVARADGGRQRVELGQRLGVQARGSRRPGSPRGSARAWCPGWAARARPAPAPRPRRPAPALRRGARRRAACRRGWRRWRAIASGWKRGLVARKSPLGNSCPARQCAGQEAAPEHAEGDERHAVVGAPRDHVRQRLARPQRELALQRAHGMRRVRARELLDRALGHAEAPDLALQHELRERTEALLDGHVGIDAVQVVEVEARRCRAARARPSQCRRIVSGRPSRTVLRRGKPRFSRPHLEAISTSGGRSRSARPTSVSLWPRPYSVAVSKCVTPSSTARCSVRSETASSCGSR